MPNNMSIVTYPLNLVRELFRVVDTIYLVLKAWLKMLLESICFDFLKEKKKNVTTFDSVSENTLEEW